MKSKIIILIILIIGHVSKAQKIIKHDITKFNTNGTMLWKDAIKESFLPTSFKVKEVNHSNNPNPSSYSNLLVFLSQIDTTNYREDHEKKRYFKTIYYFGFRDQKNLMQISQPFYADTSYAKRAPRLYWGANNCFTILTHDFKNQKNHSVDLWTIDAHGNILKKNITTNPIEGNYASLLEKDKVLSLKYLLATDSSTIINTFLPKNLGSNSFFSETSTRIVKYNTYKIGYNTYSSLESLIDEFKARYCYYYVNEKYYLHNNPIYRRAKTTDKANSGILKYDHINFSHDLKRGWKEVKDAKNRNSTSLYLSFLTDSLHFKSDAESNTYFKTRIRFGFKDEFQGYELPEDFYILENHKVRDREGTFYSRKEPCLVFSGDTFYLFVSSYVGNNLEESMIFSYTNEKGLLKQSLGKENHAESSNFPHFVQDEEYGFALKHNYLRLRSDMKTYFKDGHWETVFTSLRIFADSNSNAKITGLDLSSDHHYRQETIQPYFSPPRPNNYKQPEQAKELAYLYNHAVFFDTEESKARYKKALEFKGLMYKSNIGDYGSEFMRVDDKLPKRIFYKPVLYSHVRVPNLPALKEQGIFPSCLSYAYGALYQHAINSDPKVTKLRELDPSALKNETDISYFSMQQYIRGNKFVEKENAWRYGKGIEEESLTKNVHHFNFESREDLDRRISPPREILLQNAHQYDNIPKKIETYLKEKKLGGNDYYSWFTDYLENLYSDNKTKKYTDAELKSLTTQFSEMTGIPVSHLDLKAALLMETYYQFLYALFFSEAENFISFSNPKNIVGHFNLDDSEGLSDVEKFNILKKKIVSTLNNGRPALIHLFVFPNSETDQRGHAVLITGFQKVMDPNNGVIHDIFKVHNSWGEGWEDFTNGGWFFADHLLYALGAKAFSSTHPGEILTKNFIEQTADYKRLLGESNKGHNIDGPIGLTEGEKYVDMAELYQFIVEDYKQRMYEPLEDRIIFTKNFFKKAGYELINERNVNDKAYHLFYTGLKRVQLTMLSRDPLKINFNTLEELEDFKSRVDFSKALGKFTQKRNYSFKSGEAKLDGYFIEVTRSWTF